MNDQNGKRVRFHFDGHFGIDIVDFCGLVILMNLILESSSMAHLRNAQLWLYLYSAGRHSVWFLCFGGRFS